VLLLTNEFFAMTLAVLVLAIQFLVLWNFGWEDWQSDVVTATCSPDGTISCGDPQQTLESGFIVLMVFILLFHTLGEFLRGLQVIFPMILGRSPFRIGTLLAGGCVSGLAATTIAIAINFVHKNSDDLVSAVQDVFIIVFILDVDEKALDILEYLDPTFLPKILPPQNTENVSPTESSKEEDDDDGEKPDIDFEDE